MEDGVILLGDVRTYGATVKVVFDVFARGEVLLNSGWVIESVGTYTQAKYRVSRPAEWQGIDIYEVAEFKYLWMAMEFVALMTKCEQFTAR